MNPYDKRMNTKTVNQISKIYDLLYDLNSMTKFDMRSIGDFPMLMTQLEDYMSKKGYKVIINSKDKCKFKKVIA